MNRDVTKKTKLLPQFCRASDVMCLLSVLARVWWHSLRWHTGILSGSLVLLCEIVLILHGLLRCHASGVGLLLRCHSLWYHASSSWNLCMCIVLWGVDLGLAIDTILVAGCWLGCVQTCLVLISALLHVSRGMRLHTWIRFLPSGFVTSGWSLGVVKVYTRPVSDTTRSRTWVPVRTDNS